MAESNGCGFLIIIILLLIICVNSCNSCVESIDSKTENDSIENIKNDILINQQKYLTYKIDSLIKINTKNGKKKINQKINN